MSAIINGSADSTFSNGININSGKFTVDAATGAVSSAAGMTLAGAVSGITTLAVSGDLTYKSSVLGAWVTPAFDAGVFTSSSGTWVVAAGDATTFKYMIINKVMFIELYLITTTVTGTPFSLLITLPESKLVAGTFAGTVLVNQGSWAAGGYTAVGGSTTVSLTKTVDLGSTAWSASSDATYIVGTLIIPIQ